MSMGMDDQAASLRRLLSAGRKPCSFAFIGDQGSGVSTVVAEFAAVLASDGHRVMILDAHADMGQARRLKVNHARHLDEVIGYQGALEDTIVSLSSGAELLNLYVRPFTLANLHTGLAHRLSQEFSSRLRDSEWILIDALPPRQEPALSAIADHLILVLTPEAKSLTEAYGIIKQLSGEFGRRAFNVLINHAESLEDAQHIFRRLTYAASEYLNVSLRWVGFIPEDYHLRRALVMKTAATLAFPKSEGAIACTQLARALPLWAGRTPTEGDTLFARWLETVRHLQEAVTADNPHP